MNLLNMENYTIVMDNVAFHKSVEARNLISDSGHNLMFLPPYTPHLNPIEEFFSKWKHHVKSSNPNTVIELENAVINGVELISPSDCVGFFNDVRRYALKGVRREEF